MKLLYKTKLVKCIRCLIIVWIVDDFYSTNLYFYVLTILTIILYIYFFKVYNNILLERSLTLNKYKHKFTMSVLFSINNSFSNSGSSELKTEDKQRKTPILR